MRHGKYEKAPRRPSPVYYLLLLLFSGILIVSTWQVVSYVLSSRQHSAAFDSLAQMVEQIRSTVPDGPCVSDSPTAYPIPGDVTIQGPEVIPALPIPENRRNENGILLEYAALYAMNPDMAGWLSIEGTRIQYPVMQTPELTDYYLKRDFSGSYSEWGCIYARESCDLVTPSDNVTLYGHNMRDGSMFAGLMDYADREFWSEHRYIRFDTLTEHHVYEIFAVFTTTATADLGFAYHEFVEAADQADFDDFVARCRSLSLYDTGIVPRYGDKLICLSTCEYSQTNGRLVVAAVRIR